MTVKYTSRSLAGQLASDVITLLLWTWVLAMGLVVFG